MRPLDNTHTSILGAGLVALAGASSVSFALGWFFAPCRTGCSIDWVWVSEFVDMALYRGSSKMGKFFRKSAKPAATVVPELGRRPHPAATPPVTEPGGKTPLGKGYRSATSGRYVSQAERVAAARARVTADSKRGVKTETWIVELANKR